MKELPLSMKPGWWCCSPPFVTRRVPLLSEAQVCGRVLLEGFVTLTIFRRSKPPTPKMDLTAENQRPFDYFIPPAAQDVPYNPYGSPPRELTPVLPGQPYSYELFIFILNVASRISGGI